MRSLDDNLPINHIDNAPPAKKPRFQTNLEEFTIVSPHAYRFANKIWVDALVYPNNIYKSTRNIVFYSISPWAISIVICYFNGNVGRFLTTPAFYWGSLGILVTTTFLAYGSFKHYEVYEKLLRCFVVSESESRDIITDAIGRYSNYPQHIRAIALTFCGSVIFGALGFVLNIVDLQYRVFSPVLFEYDTLRYYGWYRHDLIAQGFSIYLIFCLFVSIPLGTATSIVLRLQKFLWEVSKLQPKLPPALIKLHFSSAASYYTVISISWLFGVYLIYLFFDGFSTASGVVVVVFLFLLGIINFSVPQIAYVRVISSAENEFLNLLSDNFNVTLNSLSIVEDINEQRYNFRTLQNSHDLLVVQMLKHDDWVYPVHQTYIVIGIYMLSALGSLIGWSRIVALVG